MSVLNIIPVPGAKGDIKKALNIIKESIPKNTVVICPYISYIFPYTK